MREFLANWACLHQATLSISDVWKDLKIRYRNTTTLSSIATTKVVFVFHGCTKHSVPAKISFYPEPPLRANSVRSRSQTSIYLTSFISYIKAVRVMLRDVCCQQVLQFNAWKKLFSLNVDVVQSLFWTQSQAVHSLKCSSPGQTPPLVSPCVACASNQSLSTTCGPVIIAHRALDWWD